MKKIIYSILTVFMLFTGVIFAGCGEDKTSYTISFEQNVFTDAERNYIEIDLTDKKEGESVDVQIRATIEGQKEGQVTVNSNYENIVKASSAYNASLNYNTITLQATSEGYAEIIVKGKSGVVEEEKILVYVYSNVSAVEQKIDGIGEKKTQYIILGEDVNLDEMNFLEISARDTCNRMEIDWAFKNNYGNSLTIDGRTLKIDEARFNEYLKTEEGLRNGKKIVLTATSRYNSEISTEVLLDVITRATVTDVKVSYDFGEFNDPDDINTKIVRTQGETERNALYVQINVVSEYALSWLSLTDENLYGLFNIPVGTLDVTQYAYVKMDANTHQFTFKIADEKSLKPESFNIDFSFSYDEYNYTVKSNSLNFSLIDVVNKIEVKDDKGEVLNGGLVRVYNTYANGKGQFFNVALYPSTAEDKEYYLYLIVEDSVKNVPTFNLENCIQFYTEDGNIISFIESKNINIPGYTYYKSEFNYSNGTLIYAKSGTVTTTGIDVAFYSKDNEKINTRIDLECEYAPEDNFNIEAASGATLNNVIETSEKRELVVKIKAPTLAGIDAESLYLDYPQSENYEISSITKDLSEITFTIKVKTLNCDEDFDIILCHKNGYRSLSAVNVKLFKALSSAKVEFVSSSSDVAKKETAVQNFGGGVDNTLSNVIASFGSTINYDFTHDANQSLNGPINIYFFVEGVDDLNGKTFETIEEFYGFVYNAGTFKCKPNTNYFVLDEMNKKITFTTVEPHYIGYAVFEFVGFDFEGLENKIHRIVRLESYVPVTTLSTINTYVDLISSGSLSYENAQVLSNKELTVNFRNDNNPITYYSLDATEEDDNYFAFRSVMGEQGNGYAWDGRELKYNDEVVYRISNLTSANGKNLVFNVEAVSTGDYIEFMDTFVITYQSYNSAYRIAFDIRITNSERVEKVIWENATIDNTIYLLERTNESLNPDNHEFSIITSVSEAYNQELDFSYITTSGNSNIISFSPNGKYQNVTVNPYLGGGFGYIYIIPKDAIKQNNDIIYSYYDEEVLKTASVPKAWLNNVAPNGQTYFEYLYNEAFFVSNDERIVPYSNILIRISLVVADGKKEETALRIYNADELKKIDQYSHYVLMNNMTLNNWSSMFVGDEFKGSLKGYNDSVTLTFTGSSLPLVDKIGSSYILDGEEITPAIKDLVFNGVVGGGFVAEYNKGIIQNVVVDVYSEEGMYKSSTARKASGNLGAIVGSNEGIIKDVQVLGVTLDGQTVGGVAGFNNGLISNAVVEIYNFNDGVNQIIGSYRVGGFVGFVNAANSIIENSYIYDYTLDKDTTNVKFAESAPDKTRIGAFVGEILYTTNAIVRNSFAVVGISDEYTSFPNATQTEGSLVLTDTYVSYYGIPAGQTEKQYISKKSSSINHKNWIVDGDLNFDNQINGGFDYLTFYQASPIDLSALGLKASNERMLVLDSVSKKVLLYYYEVNSIYNLTDNQKQILRQQNVYDLSDIFTGVDGSVALISSNEEVAKTSIDALEIVGTGSSTIKVLSKQDFSQYITFEIEVIHIISDFKISHNGVDVSRIQVQEGKNTFVDFSIKSSQYLGGDGLLYDLVLEEIEYVRSSIAAFEDYFDYDIDKNSAYIQVYYGSKDLYPDGVEIYNHIELVSGEDLINEKIEEYFVRSLNIVPFKGTERIDVYVSSLPLSPELSTTIKVDLVTDTEEDGLKLSMFENENELAIYLPDGTRHNRSVVEITESGEYIFAFGSEKKIKINATRKEYNPLSKTITYLLKASIVEDYKSKVSSTERYKLKFDAINNQRSNLIKYIELVVETQNINNINLTNYKITNTSNIDGEIGYTKSDTPVSVVAPGTKTILEAAIDPEYSYYEQVRVSYSAPSGVSASITYLQKEDTRYGEKYFNVADVKNKGGTLYIPRSSDVSAYYFGVYVSSYITFDCTIAITVSFWGYNGSNELVSLKERTFKLEVSCIPQPNISVEGESFAMLAKGSSIPVEVTIDNDQNLESLSLDGVSLAGISVREEAGNPIDNKNGTKTYKFTLFASVNAQVDDGVGSFDVKATVSRVLNGIRETKTMNATIALVEFNVKEMYLQDSESVENSDIKVFTAYENITKNLAFSYVFEPEIYNYDKADLEEIAAVNSLIAKRKEFEKNGYYSDGETFFMNYSLVNGEYQPISIKDQLYLVGSNGREMQISWMEGAVEGVYNFTYQEGINDRFILTFDERTQSFSITGKSTTSSTVLLRVKNITYLSATGRNVYWEDHYDFGIKVESFTDPDSPEVIDSAEKFNAIREQGQPKDYILMSDIELENYEPFSTSLIKSFDGNGYTIHINSFDMTKQQSTAQLALFTTVEEISLIKNVRVNWFKGGQITLDTSSEGYNDITVAGFAIENSGIIYNCDVVAYNYNNFEKVPDETGIVVSYTRNGMEYIIDQNSGVNSKIAGFVYTNSGNITNSRVGGESIRVIDNDDTVGIAEYHDEELDIFTLKGEGQVSGFASANTQAISSSAVINIQITNNSNYNKFETSGFVNYNAGNIYTSYVQGKAVEDEPNTYANLATSILTTGYAAGFVMNNSETGYISNALSNIAVSTTSLFGSGFVYRNEGEIIYSFSASQVQNSSYLQMGFTGMDENGNLLSTNGKISFSYYYDINFDADTTIENVVDTGAKFLNLNMSSSTSNYYGFSFASGDSEEERLENADGIWYVRDDKKISLVAADTISHSVRYIAGERIEENKYSFFYSNMLNTATGISSDTMIGTKNNPILITSAEDFDNAFGNSKSTFVKAYIRGNEISGAYRFVKDISLVELGVNEDGNVEVSSTSKVLSGAQIDGNGFSVDGISINSDVKSEESEIQSFGLFSKIENDSKVFNLTINISNVSADDVYVVGGLAGIVKDSYIVNVNIKQDYSLKTESDAETSKDGVKGRNAVGGLAGVVTGRSVIKNISISNAIVASGYSGPNRKLNEIDQDYYLRELSLTKIRTSLNAKNSNFAVFQDYSFAGGFIGFVDVYEYMADYLFVSGSDFNRNYRISGLKASETINVRGEVVGGLMGYTSPTTNVQDSSLKISIKEKDNDLISKILSYNGYAGGIVGLGSGYFMRVNTEYDEVTQANIENSYGQFYVGAFDASDVAKRGLSDIFVSSNTGTISYDYKPQVISGLIGVMKVGVIYNAYSKINVVAKEESQTTAGGIIGRVASTGDSNFVYELSTSSETASGGSSEVLQTTVTTTVLLKEVYASGDVRGGYYASGSVKTGFSGGIVGLLDLKAILSLEAVNAVNAFDYKGVQVEGEDETKTGELSSVGVYAFVAGNVKERGTINILTPAKFLESGDVVGSAKKTIGYYPYITNSDGDKINIKMFDDESAYTRVSFIGKTIEEGKNSIIKIGSVSEFTDAIDGFNTTSGAFLVGEHWSPENWKHDNSVYPQIKYISIREYLFLDANPESIYEVTKKMQNSDVTVYVRGLAKDGTYKDVDLTGKNISGFSGQLLGPESWLTEEDKIGGIIAKKANGEYTGLILSGALFSGVGKGFAVSNLNLYYGDYGEEPAIAPVVLNSSGSMFISQAVTGISIHGLNINIKYANVNLVSSAGNVGLVCSSISDSVIENVNVNIENSKMGVTMTALGSIKSINFGLLFGKVQGSSASSIKENTLNIKSHEAGSLITLKVPSGSYDVEEANIGSLYGQISYIPDPTIPDITVQDRGPSINLVPLNTSALEEDKLIDVEFENGRSAKNLNFGGQIGKVEYVNKIEVTAKVFEYVGAFGFSGIVTEELNYGGLIGFVDGAKSFNLFGEGSASNTSLQIGAGEIKGINAGGMFGQISVESLSETDFEIKSTVPNGKVGSRFDFIKKDDADPKIDGGQIGGLIGYTENDINIEGATAELNIYEATGTGSGAEKTTFENLNVKVGGIIPQNNAEITITGVETSGYVDFTGDESGVYAGGIISLVSNDTEIKNSVSNMTIKSNAQHVGGFVGHVDAGVNLTIEKSIYKENATIQGYGAEEKVIGGVVGYIANSTTTNSAIVSITESIFGGKILIEGVNNTATGTHPKDIKDATLDLTIGGIVGKAKFDETAYGATLDVSSSVAYGDVVVVYQKSLNQLKSYIFGGIVGVHSGGEGEIIGCLSMLTNNNDRHTSGSTDIVDAICGEDNGATISGNNFSHAVTLCTTTHATDIAYKTAYSNARKGFKDSTANSTAIELAKDEIEALITYEAKTGSKLNPIVYDSYDAVTGKYKDVLNNEFDLSSTSIEGSNGMIFFVMTSDVETSSSTQDSNALNIIESTYTITTGTTYVTLKTAFIGDGFTIKSTFKSENSDQWNVSSLQPNVPQSLVTTLTQNSFISSTKVVVDHNYDIPVDAEGAKYNAVGPIVSKMTGGIIFACGTEGDLSVGSNSYIHLGGFVGLMEAGHINESYSAVNLIHRGTENTSVASGFAHVASESAATAYGYIDNSFSTGKITTYNNTVVYAFAGAITGAKINNCYTISPVELNDYVDNKYEQTSYYFTGNATFSNCYYDSNVNNALTGRKGTDSHNLDLNFNATIATTTISGFVTKYDTNGYFNYGYPTRDIGYLKRETTKKVEGKTYHLIPNATKLAQIQSNNNYMLEYDIDLSKTSDYKDSFESISEFKGIFDGDGHTIANLKTTGGLFTKLSGATIKNLRVMDATINSTSTGSTVYLGIIARTATGSKFENITVNGNIEVNNANAYMGGLVGQLETSESTFENCINYARLSNTASNKYNCLGGIVGCVSSKATFVKCMNYGVINTKFGHAGGIAGYTEKTDISFTQCGNTNSILCGYDNSATSGASGDFFFAGGIVGYGVNTVAIEQCYNSAMIKAGNKNANTSIPESKETYGREWIAYAGGMAGYAAVDSTVTNCHNQGVIEALGSVEAGEFSYAWDEETPHKLIIRYNYNEKDDGSVEAKIINVMADAFIGNNQAYWINGGEFVEENHNYNEGQIFRNGLFESWTYAQEISFIIYGSTNKGKLGVDENGDPKYDTSSGYSGSTFTFGEQTEKVTTNAWFEIGAKTDATVYITKTDDLGCPTHFYVTVPRTIHYPKNAKDDESYEDVTTRKQEIYSSYEIPQASNLEAVRYYDKAKQDNLLSDENKEIKQTKSSGLGEAWTGDALKWMTKNAQTTDVRYTTIAGNYYSLISNAEEFGMVSLQGQSVTITLNSEYSINEKTIGDLIDAGYKFQFTYVEVDGTGVGKNDSDPDKKIDVEFNTLNISDCVISQNIFARSLNLIFNITVKNSKGATKYQPKIFYNIQAYKDSETITATLDESSLIYDRTSKKTHIYLGNLTFNKTFSSSDLKDGTNYYVTIGGNTSPSTMKYEANQHRMTIAGNKLTSWSGKTISFNVNQNTTYEDSRRFVGKIDSDNEYSDESIDIDTLALEHEESVDFGTGTGTKTLDEQSITIKNSFTENSSISVSKTQTEIKDQYTDEDIKVEGVDGDYEFTSFYNHVSSVIQDVTEEEATNYNFDLTDKTVRETFVEGTNYYSGTIGSVNWTVLRSQNEIDPENLDDITYTYTYSLDEKEGLTEITINGIKYNCSLEVDEINGEFAINLKSTGGFSFTYNDESFNGVLLGSNMTINDVTISGETKVDKFGSSTYTYSITKTSDKSISIKRVQYQVVWEIDSLLVNKKDQEISYVVTNNYVDVLENAIESFGSVKATYSMSDNLALSPSSESEDEAVFNFTATYYIDESSISFVKDSDIGSSIHVVDQIASKTDSLGNTYRLFGEVNNVDFAETPTLDAFGNLTFSLKLDYQSNNVVFKKSVSVTISKPIIVTKTTTNKTDTKEATIWKAGDFEVTATYTPISIESENSYTGTFEDAISSVLGGGLVLVENYNPTVKTKYEFTKYYATVTNTQNVSIYLSKSTKTATTITAYYKSDGSVGLTDGSISSLSINTGIGKQYVSVAGNPTTANLSLIKGDSIGDKVSLGGTGTKTENSDTVSVVGKVTINSTEYNYTYTLKTTTDDSTGVLSYSTTLKIGGVSTDEDTFTLGGKNYYYTFDESGTNPVLEVYEYTAGIPSFKSKQTVELKLKDGVWKSGVIEISEMAFDESGEPTDAEKVQYYIVYDGKLKFIKKSDGSSYSTVYSSYSTRDFGYENILANLRDKDSDTKLVDILELEYDEKMNKGNMSISTGSQDDGKQLFVQKTNLTENLNSYIYDIEVKGLCFDIEGDKVKNTTSNALNYIQHEYSISDSILSSDANIDIKKDDKWGEFLENAGSSSITVDYFGENGYTQDNSKLLIHENAVDTKYSLELTYKEFASDQDGAALSDKLEEKSGNGKVVKNESNEDGYFSVNELKLSGHILEKDVNIYKTNTFKMFTLGQTLNGNGYAINYFGNRSLFSSISSDVYNLNVGGVVFVNSDNYASQYGLLTRVSGESLINNVKAYGSISTKKEVYKKMQIAGISAKVSEETILKSVESHVNISSWSDQYDSKTETSFSAIVDSGTPEKEGVINYGTIIGYDGKDGTDGLDKSNASTGNYVYAKPTEGSAGQNINFVVSETNNGVVHAGLGGIGGKGIDTIGGLDHTDGKSHTTAVKEETADDKKTDKKYMMQTKKDNGEKGKVDSNESNVTSSAAVVSTKGCTGWNGLNLKKNIFADFNKSKDDPYGVTITKTFEDTIKVNNGENKDISINFGGYKDGYAFGYNYTYGNNIYFRTGYSSWVSATPFDKEDLVYELPNFVVSFNLYLHGWPINLFFYYHHGETLKIKDIYYYSTEDVVGVNGMEYGEKSIYTQLVEEEYNYGFDNDEWIGDDYNTKIDEGEVPSDLVRVNNLMKSTFAQSGEGYNSIYYYSFLVMKPSVENEYYYILDVTLYDPTNKKDSWFMLLAKVNDKTSKSEVIYNKEYEDENSFASNFEEIQEKILEEGVVLSGTVDDREFEESYKYYKLNLSENNTATYLFKGNADNGFDKKPAA